VTCNCAGARWVADPAYAPPGAYRPPPAPHQGLMPCPDCNPEGASQVWPPEPPPAARQPVQEQVEAQQAAWADAAQQEGS